MREIMPLMKLKNRISEVRRLGLSSSGFSLGTGVKLLRSLIQPTLMFGAEVFTFSKNIFNIFD